MADPGATYSLPLTARALAAQTADASASTWLVGTNALREENEVRVLKYDAEEGRLDSVRALHHANEVWSIAPSPEDTQHLVTVWSKCGDYGASLWRMEDSGLLHEEAALEGHAGTIHKAMWHGTDPSLVVTIEEGALRTWRASSEGMTCTASASAGELVQLWGGALHPRQPSVAATAGGHNVQLWDLRSMELSAQTAGAHRLPARDVSFSPADDHRIVSAGDDCKLRLWDTRMLGSGEALLELGGHSHWVWQVAFNPKHDSLIASSSSDTLVNLYHTPWASAARRDGSAAGCVGSHRPGGDADGLAHTYDEHDDSVYGLSWSVADPWVFATLSYDGRVVVNKVSKQTKYAVLL